MASYGPDLKLAATTPRGVTAVGTIVSGVDDLSPDRTRFADANGFEAKPGQSLVLSSEDGPIEVLIGVGEDPEVDDYRRAGASFARAVSRQRTAALLVGSGADPATITALVEGLGMGSYRYTAQKGKGTTNPPATARITVVI